MAILEELKQLRQKMEQYQEALSSTTESVSSARSNSDPDQIQAPLENDDEDFFWLSISHQSRPPSYIQPLASKLHSAIKYRQSPAFIQPNMKPIKKFKKFSRVYAANVTVTVAMCKNSALL